MAVAAPRHFGAFGGLVARDPFRELARFQRAFTPLAEEANTFVPRLDAVEDADAFRITAEVPGVDEADLSVEIEAGVLTLKGEKKSYLASESDKRADSEGRTSGATEVADFAGSRFHRQETRCGRFERRLRFNAEVDEAGVKASYRNGVLTVVVPKIAEAVPALRTIPVQTA